MKTATSTKGEYNFGRIYGLDDIDAILDNATPAVPFTPAEKTALRTAAIAQAAQDAELDREAGRRAQASVTAKLAAKAAVATQDEGDEGDLPVESMRGQLAIGKRRAFVLAGKAIVTIRSKATGSRFTYKVTQSKPEPGRVPVWFVALLNGSDNTSDYQYIGTIFADGFRVTKKSRLSNSAPSVIAFSWFGKHWEDSRIEVWHEGRCGRCGRTLTVPESIESGLGPICASK